MAGGRARWLAVAAFAIAVGHLAWYAWIAAPLAAPEYVVGGDVRALTGVDPTAKQLYLRHTLYLSERPRHAWIQVLGRDRLRLLVNGKFVEGCWLEGSPVAIVADLVPFLRIGRNAIAIAAQQDHLHLPPVVAVEGAYTQGAEEHRLSVAADWRCGAVNQRTAFWWFDPEFDDRHWPMARLCSCRLRAKVSTPPRATIARTRGSWITPLTSERGISSVRRVFTVSGRPHRAWLRLAVVGSYRLAVNGVLLDQQEDQLTSAVPGPVALRTYDLTPLVQRGENVIALVLAATSGPPHLRADLEVTDDTAERWHSGTDEQWVCQAGLAPNWMAPAALGKWAPGERQAGDLDVQPWDMRRQAITLSLPASTIARRLGEQALLMAGIALLTLLACQAAAWLLAMAEPKMPPEAAGGIYLALVPAPLLIAVAVLATYDPRLAAPDIYRGIWVFLAVASVPVQWLLFPLLGRRRSVPSAVTEPERERRVSRLAVGGLVVALLAVGFWLRVRDVGTEAMHWDEVENYYASLGLFQYGFPGYQAHPDLPKLLIHTSELFYVPTALATLVFADDRWVIRFPSVCWGTATIFLLFVTGRRLLNGTAGLVAAALYTFAPMCICMTNFGRYFSQLQFFALLTVYCYWLTIRGSGRISRWALWATAASFSAMFLTFEVSALVAPGMVVAALVQRRGRLRTLLGEPQVWMAMLIVALVVVLQNCHATFQKTQFLWYGISLSDASLQPMWRYPIARPWYYIWQSGWSRDALLPMIGLAGAMVLAIRHPWHRPLRYLLLIYLVTCLAMALFLPNIQWRYIHHMIPIQVLLSAAVVAALQRGLVRMVRPRAPAWCWLEARCTGLLTAATLVAVGSGLAVDLSGLSRFRAEGFGVDTFKFPDLDEPSKYICRHMRAGDVVMATEPLTFLHFTASRARPGATEVFWLSTVPYVPSTVDDRCALLRERRSGTEQLATLKSIEDLFARRQRVWFVGPPTNHFFMNCPEISTYLRSHMDVVYEDHEALVLFKGANHRPVEMQLQQERALQQDRPNFLP